MELMKEAWHSVEPWTHELLAFVREVEPANCFGFLQHVVSSHYFPDAMYKLGLDREWLSTAAVYPVHSLLQAWIDEAGRDPGHASIAYQALSQDPDLALQYLPEYVASLRTDERELLQRYALERVYQQLESIGTFYDRLLRYAGRYIEKGLSLELINEALKKLQLNPVFTLTQTPDQTPPPPSPSTPPARASFKGAATHKAA